jgi:predicted aconitase with swiveling domain
MEVKGRVINRGKAEGIALVSSKPISFYGGVDAKNGVVTDKESDIDGQSISGKILVFPFGKGSTVAPYTIYQLAKAGKAPLAMLNKECETIVAVGCIISDIPAVDQIDISKIKTGDKVRIENDIVKIV